MTDNAETQEGGPVLPLVATPASISALDVGQQSRQTKLAGMGSTGPVLASLYGRAAELLPTCDDLADLALLSHCMRELLNRLPDLVGDRIEGYRTQREEAMNALTEAWEVAGLGMQPPEAGSPGQLPVPSPVFAGAQDVVRHHNAGRGANRRKCEVLAADGAEPGSGGRTLSPAARAISDTRDYFWRYTHIDSSPRPAPDPSEVRQHFSRVETILDRHLKAFWSGHDAIRALLAQTNSVAAGPES